MTPTYTTLLRRTAAAVAAISSVFVSVNAFAQSPGAVRLETSTGTTTATECSYGTMSVQPNGAIRVVCSGSISVTGGSTQPPPTTGTPSYSLSSSGGTVSAGTNTGLTMIRSGDPAARHVVLYNVDGDACTGWGDYAVTFAAGSSTPQAIPQAVIKSTGTRCVITLGPTVVDGAYVNMKGATTVATFTVGTGGGGGPTVPAGCPAAPSNAQYETFGVKSTHNRWRGDPTGGRVIIAQMPSWSEATVPSMISMNSPFVYTPASGTVRYSISKCPGEIKTDYSDACNQVSDVTMWTGYWLPRAYGGLNSKQTANASGYCWAPEAEGPWYMNIRYEFNGVCGGGETSCGMMWQYY